MNTNENHVYSALLKVRRTMFRSSCSSQYLLLASGSEQRLLSLQKPGHGDESNPGSAG